MGGPILECIQKRITTAEEECNVIQQLEISVRKGESLNNDQQMLLKSKKVIIKLLEILKHAKEISCRRKHGRYLCISNGLTLVCLDLKDGLKQKPIDKLQPLPKIHTLVAAENLGQQKYPHLSGNLFSCFVYAVKDSALCKMYSFSTDGADFCLSKQDTSTNNNTPPQYSSMLNQDEGSSQIHVVETIPKASWHSCIPNSLGDYQIVIDDRVYAKYHFEKEFKVFNTKALQEYIGPLPIPDLCLSYMESYVDFPRIPIRHVVELLGDAFVRCIGKLKHSDSSNPLYVVIAVKKNEHIAGAASAYLVASTGQVLCYQSLPCFFTGLSEILTQCVWLRCLQCTVISADEEGKTLCAIVPLVIRPPFVHFLFISTFTVEDCVYDKLLPSILAQKCENGDAIWDLPLAQKRHFLNVEVKEWNAYELCEADMYHFPHLSACFLSTQ